MRLVRAATVSVAVLCLAASTGWAVDPPKIAHVQIACVPEDGNALITVNVTFSSPIVSARVYYHSVAKTSGDYYLELRQGQAGRYWGVLPIPLDETKRVQYRIVVKDADGQVATSESYNVPTSTPCPVTLNAEETRYANNLVIGLTSDSQPAIPDGFRCKGVVIKITPQGELMPNEECRKVLAAAAGGIPTVLWALGGASVAAGGAAIAVNNAGCNCPPVSTARPPSASARK